MSIQKKMALLIHSEMNRVVERARQTQLEAIVLLDAPGEYLATNEEAFSSWIKESATLANLTTEEVLSNARQYDKLEDIPRYIANPPRKPKDIIQDETDALNRKGRGLPDGWVIDRELTPADLVEEADHVLRKHRP